MGRLLRILIIEDDVYQSELVSAILEHKFESLEGQFCLLDHATTLRQGQSILAQGATDLVVLDLGLPDTNSRETYRTIRAAYPELPIIILTGSIDSLGFVELLQDARGVDTEVMSKRSNWTSLLGPAVVSLLAPRWNKEDLAEVLVRFDI